MVHLTHLLADHALSIDVADLPGSVIERAGDCILDLMTAAIAGRGSQAPEAALSASGHLYGKGRPLSGLPARHPPCFRLSSTMGFAPAPLISTMAIVPPGSSRRKRHSDRADTCCRDPGNLGFRHSRSRDCRL